MPAFEFYHEMTNPNAANLYAGPSSDQTIAGTPLYGRSFGNMMYGPGTEAPMMARSASMAGGIGSAAGAGAGRQAAGAGGWQDLVNQFAQQQFDLKAAQQAGQQQKDLGIGGLLDAILKPVISGDPGNIFSQLVSGGQPLGQVTGLDKIPGMFGNLFGLSSGGGLLGLLGFGGTAGASGAEIAGAAGLDETAGPILDLLMTGAFAGL